VNLMPIKVLVIIPTYNEAANISRQLREIDAIRSKLSSTYDLDILNVDDNSPDGTADLARTLKLKDFHQIINAKKNGLGPAYISGFKWGLERDYDLFVEMDSDGSHLTGQLLDLLEASKGIDLVIGTRWMAGGNIENWPWYRKLISKGGTAYAARALKLPFKDLTSGYRVLSRQFLESLDLNSISSKGYGFQIEIAFQAYVNGFTIAQVPITFIERKLGSSKMTLGIALEAFRFISLRGLSRILSVIIRR